MERIPEDRPVLLVGNHSGGNVTPDTVIFALAFNTYFGVERRFYQLAHNLVLPSRGRWRLRELADGRTQVTFRFAYGVAGGGLAGLIAERVAAPSLNRRFRISLLNLKNAVERETVSR